jgi:hypothetical protein
MLFRSFAASVANLIGASFAAQLEAVRAGTPQPRSSVRVEDEPKVDTFASVATP